MRGLVFDISIARYALAKGVGRLLPTLHYGKLSGLALRELPPPKLPGKGWIRLKPRWAGVCGSDIATLFFKMSPESEPFSSFPAVLGHEVLAEVTDVGDEPCGLEVGQRVAVDPSLPCRLRGFSAPCPSCAQGIEGTCERTAEGTLAPGSLIGYHRELPGAFGDEMVAHVSQLYPVPVEVPDKAAVLIEPLAVCMHAVLKHPPRQTDRVLVVGGGPVAFGTLWALRASGARCHVTHLARREFQLELGRRMGADDAFLANSDELAEAQEVARRTEGRALSPIIGPPVVAGGYDLVFDCVGTRDALQHALRYTRAQGRLVLLGCASQVERFDFTSVWRNELTVSGAFVYGREIFRGQPLHTFDVVRTLLSRREGPDVTPMVTHVFRLEQYSAAIEANLDRGTHQAVKTVFDLRQAP